jgi:Spy/CpxP family protein refolding chaperone
VSEATQPDPLPRRRPSRLVPAVILAGLFVMGFGAGVMLDRAVLHHRHGPFAGMGPGRAGMLSRPERRAEMRRHLADRITDDLSLTLEQRAQLDSILQRREAPFDSLRIEMDRRLRALLDSSSAEVERILTPEQRDKWVTLRRKFDQPGGIGGSGGPPPGP